MITLKDLKRYLAPLERKIYLLIGRAILAAVNNGESTQKVQITGMYNETMTDVERVQEYGLESYPRKGAEAIVAFLNGKQSRGLILKIGDRRYRLSDLVEGEVALYTDEDGSTESSPGALGGEQVNPEMDKPYTPVGFRIHLKRNQTMELLAMMFNFVAGKSFNVTAPLGHFDIQIAEITGQLRVGEDVKAARNVQDMTGTMQQMRALYNSHSHPWGGPPEPKMT
uniref:Putative baseplate assembly protein n=1 Tax=viral metagenome TaxID=1070528 RepID=A0A6M3IUZ5_9ZZZZ